MANSTAQVMQAMKLQVPVLEPEDFCIIREFKTSITIPGYGSGGGTAPEPVTEGQIFPRGVPIPVE